MDYVKKYTDLDYEFFEEPNRVVVRTKWEDEPGVFVKKDTQIRYRGGIKSPILTEVFKETELTVLEKGERYHILRSGIEKKIFIVIPVKTAVKYIPNCFIT